MGSWGLHSAPSGRPGSPGGALQKLPLCCCLLLCVFNLLPASHPQAGSTPRGAPAASGGFCRQLPPRPALRCRADRPPPECCSRLLCPLSGELWQEGVHPGSPSMPHWSCPTSQPPQRGASGAVLGRGSHSAHGAVPISGGPQGPRSPRFPGETLSGCCQPPPCPTCLSHVTRCQLWAPSCTCLSNSSASFCVASSFPRDFFLSFFLFYFHFS